MAAETQEPEGRDAAPSLNVTIEALDLAKETSGITPVKTAFGSVSGLLATIGIRSLLLQSNCRVFRAHVNSGLGDRIMSGLGYLVSIFAEPLTGE